MIKTNKSFIYSMILPSAVLLTVLSIFPLFFTIKNSFTDYYLLSKTRSSFIGVRNYVNIFKDAYFQKSLWNTVKFTVLAVIAETLFGLVLALFVNSLRKGQHLVRTLCCFPCLCLPLRRPSYGRRCFQITTELSIRCSSLSK